MARITLRIPERLKVQVERAAQGQGISVNSWLVDAAARALQLPLAGRRGPRGRLVICPGGESQFIPPDVSSHVFVERW